VTVTVVPCCVLQLPHVPFSSLFPYTTLFRSRGNRLPLYCLFLGGIFFSLLVIQCLSSFCNGFSVLTCPFYIFSLSVLFRLRHAFLKFFARSFEIFFSLCDSVLCGYW